MPNLKILPINDISLSPLSENIKKILIIKPSSLGDVIHTFPVIAFFKSAIPGVQIDWLINKNISSILDYLDDFLEDKVLFNRSGFKGMNFIIESCKLVHNIRKKKYDCIIDLQGLLRSSIMTFMGKGKYKVGFSNPKEKISRFAYNLKIDLPDNIEHAIEKNIYLVSKFLKIDPVVPAFNIPLIKKYKDIIDNVSIEVDFKLSDKKYFIVAPGARWNSKRWSTDFFAQTLDIISEKSKLIPIIIGTKDEKILSEEIIEKCKNANPVSLVAKTSMIELVELLRNARLILTNDSGPMHIAASLGTNVLALFGATDPELTGPYWPNSKVFQKKEGCIKCFKRECNLDKQECQDGFSSEYIAKEILKYL